MTNIMCHCEKKTMGMGQPKQNDILYASGEKNSILYIQVTDETAIHKTVCPMVTDC